MSEPRQSLIHHVPKDELRPGSAVDSDPPWPAFDVVHRVEYERLRDALRLIRDGRCECGGRFKWTGNQTRCEQCDAHQSYGYGGAIDIAKRALNV